MTLCNPKLKNHFVAFIDILGFSEMVIHDCESPPNSELFIEKLYVIYEETKKLDSEELDLNVVQFSDTIVISSLFNKENFETFLKIVTEVQYKLFINNLLCRGGITYGKFYQNNGFVYGNGLIESYLLEKDVARYPRIVVSSNLLTLIYEYNIDTSRKSLPILKEFDGNYFLDFIGSNDLNDCCSIIKKIISSHVKVTPSIKEKHRWLIEYFEYKLDSSRNYSITSPFKDNRFSNKIALYNNLNNI